MRALALSRGTQGLLLAVSILGLAACSRPTPVKEILDHPREYADKHVTVEGDVKDVFSLVVIRYFTLDDGSGEIGVVSEKPLPKRGEHLRVGGTVKEAFSFGDQTTLMLVEDGPEMSAQEKQR